MRPGNQVGLELPFRDVADRVKAFEQYMLWKSWAGFNNLSFDVVAISIWKIHGFNHIWFRLFFDTRVEAIQFNDKWG